MSIIKKLKSESGSALFLAVIMLSTVLVIGFSMASVVLSGVMISGVQQRSTVAFYAAEAGAERTLFEYRKNGQILMNDATSTNVFGTTTFSNTSYYTVDYASSTDVLGSTTIKFSSDGNFKETKRRVELTF